MTQLARLPVPTIATRLAQMQADVKRHNSVAEGAAEVIETIADLIGEFTDQPDKLRQIAGWLTENGQSLAEGIAAETLAHVETLDC